MALTYADDRQDLHTRKIVLHLAIDTRGEAVDRHGNDELRRRARKTLAGIRRLNGIGIYSRRPPKSPRRYDAFSTGKTKTAEERLNLNLHPLRDVFLPEPNYDCGGGDLCGCFDSRVSYER